MKQIQNFLRRVMFGTVAMVVVPLVQAQIQTTRMPGSSGATWTVVGKRRPPSDPKFGSVIKESVGSQTG